MVGQLRAALEELEAVGAQRADIEDMMKRAKEGDNIISKVMASTDSYDRLFETELVGTIYGTQASVS